MSAQDKEGPAAPFDMQGLARDWITIWQSEMAALAADREAQEAMQKLAALWAGFARAAADFLPGGTYDPFAATRAAQSPWPTAAAAAPDARDLAIDRLGQRLTELEQRLAKFERGAPRNTEPDPAT